MRRNSIQQYRDLLKTIIKYPQFRLSRIIAIAGVGQTVGTEMLSYLESFGFIKQNNRTYTLTKKGYDWQKQYTALEGELLNPEQLLEAKIEI